MMYIGPLSMKVLRSYSCLVLSKYNTQGKGNVMKLYSVCGHSRPHTVTFVKGCNVDLIPQ